MHTVTDEKGKETQIRRTDDKRQETEKKHERCSRQEMAKSLTAWERGLHDPCKRTPGR